MRKFFLNNLIILILLNSSNVFNYLFQLIVGRSLTTTDYGSFNAINSIAVLLSAPVAVLPLVFSRYTTTLTTRSYGQLKNLLILSLRWMTLAGGLLFVTGLVTIPWLQTFLHIEARIPIIIMLAQLMISLIFPILLGAMQGLQRFTLFGICGSSSAIIRCLSGLLLVSAFGWGVNGALLSAFIGIFCAVGIGLWSLRDILKVPGESLPDNISSDMRRYSLPIFLSSTLVIAIGQLDIVLVKHYCSGEEAGLYSAAALVGRIALYLPSVLTVVLFPMATKEHISGAKNPRILWASLGMTALLGLGFALICKLWPEQIIILLFGEKFQSGAELLKTISLAMALLAISNVIFTHNLARSEFKFLWTLTIGVAVMLLLIFNFHDSALTIAKIVLYSTGCILIGILCFHTNRSSNFSTPK